MIHRRKVTGFTLIELMLAMGFVGALLIAIATTSILVMNTYSKGITLREVNQSGRSIAEDIQRTIATSSIFTVSPANTGDEDGPVDTGYVIRPGGGRLCTGAYTYAWNYGTTIELSGATDTHIYNTYTDESDDDTIRLIKVRDAGGLLCLDAGRTINKAETKELLSPGDRNLAIQEFIVTSNSQDPVSGQALYAVSFTLGTNDHTQLNASSSSCLAPSKGSGSEDFCAINQFNIIARAGNRSGSL